MDDDVDEDRERGLCVCATLGWMRVSMGSRGSTAAWAGWSTVDIVLSLYVCSALLRR